MTFARGFGDRRYSSGTADSGSVWFREFRASVRVKAAAEENQ
jgi:hypothetical protein